MSLMESLHWAYDKVDHPVSKKYLQRHIDNLNPRKLYEEAEKMGVDKKSLRDLGLKLREDGLWTQTDEDVRMVMSEIDRHLEESGNKEVSDLIEPLSDPKYVELKAALVYCVTGVDELVGKEMAYLYRAFLRENLPSGIKKSQKKSKDYAVRPAEESTEQPVEERIVGGELGKFVRNLPDEFYDSDKIRRGKDILEKEKDESYDSKKLTEEEKRLMSLARVRVVLRKLVDKETFKLFQRDQKTAYRLLEERLREEDNYKLKDVYGEVLSTYGEYVKFEFSGVNPEFRDPETGNKGTLPSIHQKIAACKAKKELERDDPNLRSFAVYDGCGTGKTFIGVGLKDIVEKEMEKKGREPTGRAVVLCRKSSFEPWEKGLEGGLHERYLEEKQKKIILNGEKKDEDLFEKLKEKKWIILNYEQLTTDFSYRKDGQKVEGIVADALYDLGFDYLIVDESHNIKNREDFTPKNNDSYSFAARRLAKDAYFKLLLTATPVFDNPRDYAVPLSILRPDLCEHPKDFIEMLEKDSGKSVVTARKLYFYIAENSVRRTEAEINDLEDKFSEEIVNVEMTAEQRALHDYIFTIRRHDWLTQIRKSLLDPKLVDPDILKKAKVEPTDDSSAKYRKLEELICGDESKLVKDGKLEDKFVIFSSEFAEGVTREAKSLGEKYRENGYDFNKLGLGKSPLKERLEKKIREKFGEGKYLGIIDGAKSTKERDDAVDKFRTEDNCVGMICTTEAGGESLNFSNANHAFFLDEAYTPSETDQAKGRLLRRGQKKFVHFNYLRAADSLDEFISRYVHRKRLVIRIAEDGYPLLEEEKKILERNDNIAVDYLLRGGVPINTRKMKIDSLDFFDSKSYETPFKRAKRQFGRVAHQEPTMVQVLTRIIGRAPQDCWADEDFARRYSELLPYMSVFPVHYARICEVMKLAKKGLIKFPSKILSEGSGPSILYRAYEDLESLIKKEGYKMPVIVDRDNHQSMLTGKNENKILGNMNGRESSLKDESVDFVDNASITLLPNAQEMKETLLEANRVLKKDGVLSLCVQSYKFPSSFYSGMEKLGFEVLTEENQGVMTTAKARRRLRDKFDLHYTESYTRKMEEARIVIAKKISDASPDVDPDDLWIQREERVEDPDARVKSEHDERRRRPKVTVVRERGGRIREVRGRDER